jgi:DNA topoisomerase III
MDSLIRYMGGLLSYPRTESTAYPEGFDFVTTVRAQQGHPERGEHAAWLLEEPGRLQVR